MTDGMTCEHKKGGVCVLHGPGAKLRWKPIGPKIVTYVNGKKKTSYNKDYFYVCDLGLLGSGKTMKQTMLSLLAVKTTDSEDDTVLGLREPCENSTATEGQKQRCEMN